MLYRPGFNYQRIKDEVLNRNFDAVARQFDQVAHAFQGFPALDVRDFGARGNANNWDVAIGSAKDNTTPIKNAIAAGKAVVFPSGIYMVTEPLVLPNYSHLIFLRGAKILANHTGASVLSLKGASECIIENPYLLGHITTYPKTGIELGRSATNACTRNAIYNAYVAGYFSQAGIYSIAAEETSLYTPRTDIRGGGAKYCFFTSDSDELSVDSLTAGSNTVVNVHNPNFANEQTGLSGAAGIYIGTTIGATFNHLYNGGWVYGKSGAYVQINSEYNGVLAGPLTFVNFHGEGFSPGAGTKGLYLSTALTSDITLNAINMQNAYVSNPEYFLYASDYIVIQNSQISPHVAVASSIYKAVKSDFGQWENVTIRQTSTPRIQLNSAGNTPKQLTNNSATPSVTGGNIFYSQNTSPTTITNFTNGTVGQIIYIVFYNANATIATNDNIKLSATFNSQNTYTLTLIHDGTRWYELARKVADA